MQEFSGFSAADRGAGVDVDSYRKTEAALRERERELTQLVDMVPSHLWRLTPAGEPIFFNRRMVDYLGLDVAATERAGMSRLEVLIATTVHPEDRQAFSDGIHRSLGSGEPFALRYRLRRRDGAYRWMSSRAEPMRDELGAVLQWYGLCHDIDDEVNAQQALRDRERELSQLIDMVPSHVWRLTPGGGEPSFINKRLSDFLGLNVTDYHEKGMDPLAAAIITSAHPEDALLITKAIGHSLATGEHFSMRWRIRRADGVYRWVESRAEPLRDISGAIVQWYGVNVDIDDQMTAQQALRDREREYSQLVDIVPGLLWRLNPEGEPLFFSKRMIEYLGLDVGGYDEPGMTGLASAIVALVHPEDAARVVQALDHSFTTGDSFAVNYRLRRADGVYRWMSGRGEPLRDESGRILQWYGLCHDIDDQLRAEDALRESEQQLRRLVDALPTQIWAASPEGEPSYLNRRLAQYVGLSLEDLDVPDTSRLQAAIQNSVHPDDAAAVGAALGHAFTTGQTFAMKYRQRRADGVYRWINGRAEPLRDDAGHIQQWYGVSFDIDDDVRTQDELRRTRERLAAASQAASLAELSASIAHEVNQPLAAVVANAYASQRWLDVDPPNVERARAAVDRVVRDANGAAEVVGRIRALFRQSKAGRVPTRLDSLIAEARSLLADEALRHRVRIDADVEPQLPAVPIDRVQIQQVLINLMRNGIEAMAGTGGDRLLTVGARQSDAALLIEVTDLGPGAPDMEHMFDPFFTTKENGMGMGLAISRSIVESHGGRLWAGANTPRGARVSFTLPVEVTNEF